MTELPFEFEIDVVGSDAVVPATVPAPIAVAIAPVVYRPPVTGVLTGIGTAFRIAAQENGQSLYVTARHVIAELNDDPSIEFYILIPRSTTDPSMVNELAAVRIDSISLPGSHSDVALVRTDLRNLDAPIEVDRTCFPLALRQAQKGQVTLAFGYPIQEITGDVQVRRELHPIHGEVEEIHNARRDRSMNTFPSFRVSGNYEHGMSGGPVFDENAGVIGVVSHGMAPTDGSPPYGYAASIAALAELRMELDTPEGGSQLFTVPELHQHGIIRLRGDTGVTINRNEEGMALTWIPATPTEGGDEAQGSD